MKKIAVIGLGNFGYTLAVSLAKEGCEVIAIDTDKGKIQSIKDSVSQAVLADAACKETLEKLGVGDVDAAVVCLGTRLDLGVMVTLFLKELGVGTIYAKAISDDHSRVLCLVGADKIIFPEKDEAQRLAKTVANPNVLEFVRLTEGYSVVEFPAPKKFHGRSLSELDLKNRFGIYVFAVRQPHNSELQLFPPAGYVVRDDDTLIIVGEEKKIEAFEGEFS